MKPDVKGPWIALYTKTIYSETFNHLTCAERSVFLQGFFLAARMEYDCLYNGRFYHVRPGQFVISQRDLAKQCGEGCTRKIVRSTIDKLVASHTWAQSRAKSGAQSPNLITFINWSVYQHPVKERAQSRAQQGAQLGPTDTPQPCFKSEENHALQGSYKVYTQTREKSSPQPETDPIDVQGVQDAWTSICVPAGLHGVRDWSAWNDRIRTAWKRIAASKDPAWAILTPLDRFKDLFTHASKVGFLTGGNDRKWKADLEFVLRPLSVDRIMTGFYEDRPKEKYNPNKSATDVHMWDNVKGW